MKMEIGKVKNVDGLIELESPADMLMVKGDKGLLHMYMNTVSVLAVALDCMDKDTFKEFSKQLSYVELGALHGEEAVEHAKMVANAAWTGFCKGGRPIIGDWDMEQCIYADCECKK